MNKFFLHLTKNCIHIKITDSRVYIYFFFKEHKYLKSWWDKVRVKTGKETNYLSESTSCDKHVFSQAVDRAISREL